MYGFLKKQDLNGFWEQKDEMLNGMERVLKTDWKPYSLGKELDRVLIEIVENNR